MGDSLFKNRSRQTSVRKYRRLFDLALELGERLNGAVKSFSALREHSYAHIFIYVQVRVYKCIYFHTFRDELLASVIICVRESCRLITPRFVLSWLHQIWVSALFNVLCALSGSDQCLINWLCLSPLPFSSCFSEAPSVLGDFQQFHSLPKHICECTWGCTCWGKVVVVEIYLYYQL